MDNNTNNNRLENEEATHQEENQTPQTVRAEHNDNINEQPAQNVAADDQAQSSPAEKQQVSGEYSWVNPNYAPHTGQTNTSGQGQQGSAPSAGSYTYNPYGQQNAQSLAAAAAAADRTVSQPLFQAPAAVSRLIRDSRDIPAIMWRIRRALSAPAAKPGSASGKQSAPSVRKGTCSCGGCLHRGIVAVRMGGAYYVNRNMTNDKPSILAPRTGDETGLSYQAVLSEVSGTTDSKTPLSMRSRKPRTASLKYLPSLFRHTASSVSLLPRAPAPASSSRPTAI